MAILDSELLFYKSQTVNDTTSNGGRMSTTSITSGASQNVFPNVLSAERTSGSTKYRKVFLKVANDDDLSLLSPRFWFDFPTKGGDHAIFFEATQRNTQADITGSERIYGCAGLKTAITGGATSTIVVTVEDTSLTGMFQDGDTIRISDKATPDSGTGNEEYLTITGTPSVASDEVTITVTSSVSDSYSVYDFSLQTGARVMPVLELSDLECTFDNWVETSASGTYDETTYPVEMDNIGTIEQTWTITFTDATNFTVSGDTVGSLTSGAIGSDYSYDNPDFTKPYFTLLSAGWGGTWTSGDTVVFQTHPASSPIWEKRVVPAGTSSLSGNKIVLATSGESA